MPLYLPPDWITVMKPSPTSTSQDTALSNDPHLFFTVPPGEAVSFSGRVFFETPAAADFKYAFDFSGVSPDPTIQIQVASIAGGATAFGNIAVQKPTVSTVVVTGTGTYGYVTFDGFVDDFSGDGFDLHFQWAQNTSQLGATIVQAGSYLRYFVI